MEIKGNRIILNKEINNLDRFTIDFVDILKNHTKYVIISDYVSILFGRSKISEDVDILIPVVDYDKFLAMVKDLDNEFWCINSEDKKEMFELLKDGHSIRFAKKNKVIPNIELKFAKKFLDEVSISKRIEVNLGKHTLFISPIELQIAYKENVLKTPKDMEDALHLKEVFKNDLEKEKIKFYKDLIKEHEGYQ